MCFDGSVLIEVADPEAEESRGLLRAHECDMAQRYPQGSWAGTGGAKDHFWLARDKAGSAVGCVALRVLAPDRVEVKHLYVMPSARRAGVGQALMDALEAEARARGAAIVLETGLAQPEAIALYRARGYRSRGPYDGCDIDDVHSVYLELAPPPLAPPERLPGTPAPPEPPPRTSARPM